MPETGEPSLKIAAKEDVMAGNLSSDTSGGIEHDIKRFVVAYENAQRGGRLSTWAKLSPAIASLAALIGLFLSLDSIKDGLDKLVAGDVPNTQNLPLTATRFNLPTASSYRQDVAHAVIHSPLRVLDDDRTTDWAECKGGDPVHAGTSRMSGRSCGTSTGADSGTGEWLQLELTSPEKLKLIRIRNGNQASDELFYRNPRARDLRITRLDESGEPFPTQEVTLADEQGYQTFSLDEEESATQTVRLTILSSYPGEPFLGQEPYSDTSLSDVQLIPSQIPSSAN